METFWDEQQLICTEEFVSLIQIHVMSEYMGEKVMNLHLASDFHDSRLFLEQVIEHVGSRKNILDIIFQFMI